MTSVWLRIRRFARFSTIRSMQNANQWLRNGVLRYVGIVAWVPRLSDDDLSKTRLISRRFTKITLISDSVIGPSWRENLGLHDRVLVVADGPPRISGLLEMLCLSAVLSKKHVLLAVSTAQGQNFTPASPLMRGPAFTFAIASSKSRIGDSDCRNYDSWRAALARFLVKRIFRESQ